MQALSEEFPTELLRELMEAGPGHTFDGWNITTSAEQSGDNREQRISINKF